MNVAIARARHGHVGRENKRIAFGGVRLVEQVAHEATIADHVELKPKRRGRRLGDFRQ